MIVYSDGLNIETCVRPEGDVTDDLSCIDLKQFADQEGIGCSFGVGTRASSRSAIERADMPRRLH